MCDRIMIFTSSKISTKTCLFPPSSTGLQENNQSVKDKNSTESSNYFNIQVFLTGTKIHRVKYYCHKTYIVNKKVWTVLNILF